MSVGFLKVSGVLLECLSDESSGEITDCENTCGELEVTRGMGRKSLAQFVLGSIGGNLCQEATREYRLDLYFGEEANLVIPCLRGSFGVYF